MFRVNDASYRYLNQELTTSLKEQTDENKVLMETLSKMTMERSGLLERIRSLEDRNNYKVPFDDPISRVSYTMVYYAHIQIGICSAFNL